MLYYFFKYYSRWEWNYKNPIYLVPVPHEQKYGINPKLLYEENPKHLMPVLTCAYPSMNSTHNVSESTKAAILTEFEKALQICEAVLKRDEATGARAHPELSWKRLFKKFNFFGAYTHFIQLSVLSVDADTHNKWLGFSESKIRHLLNELQSLSNIKGNFGLEFRPWSKSYRVEATLVPVPGEDTRPRYTESDSFYIGIRVKKNINLQHMQIDLSQKIRDYYRTFMEVWVQKSEELTKWMVEGSVDIRIAYLRQEQLPEEVRPKRRAGGDAELEPASKRQKV